MSNEEKAREIELNVYAFEKPKGEFEAPAYRASLEMAEWKDQQFKDYLAKKRTEIEQGILHSNPLIDWDRWCGRADAINEIINELFGGE